MHLSRLYRWAWRHSPGLDDHGDSILWSAAPARAQSTCNGVPATINGVAPGPITGTDGNDVILGTTAADQIGGLGGDDIICAGAGNDQVSGGDGNDTLVWNPGDGSDVVEGQAGTPPVTR